MHVAYDLRYAADHFTGVGRHAWCLFEALLDLPGPERYTVLWNPALKMTRFDLEPLRRHPRVEWVERSFGPMSPAQLWQVGAWLRGLKPDVYFSPFYFMQLGAPCPCVLTVHDVWPLRLGYGLEPWKREVYRWMLRLAARARLVVTSSDFSRREIEDLVSIDAARLRVVRLGVPPVRKEIVPQRPRHLPDRRFAFTVGLNYPYKNLATLVEAWAVMGDDAPLDLVASGRELDRYPRLAELARARGVRRITTLGHVTEGELEWLYQNATTLVFPTTYEGFGFPLVEAFAHGLSAIASDIPVLREIDNGATRFVPARDPLAWAQAVRDLARDDAKRLEMAALGREQIRRMTYPETARAVLDILREAAHGGAVEAAA